MRACAIRTVLKLLLASVAAWAPAAQAAGQEGDASGAQADTPDHPWFDAAWREQVAPLIQDTCFDCHGGDGVLEGGLDLTRLPELPAREGLGVIHHLRRRVRGREMPPSDFMELTDTEVERIATWADRALAKAGRTLELDPGRVAARKLSRSEYDRAIRDLFGVATPLSALFPADTASHGFDNIGGGSFSMLHLEKYHAAAVDVAERVIDVADPDNPQLRRIHAPAMRYPSGVRLSGDSLRILSRAGVQAKLRLPRDGRYRVRLHCYGDQAGPDPVRVGFQINGGRVLGAEVRATREAPEFVAWEVPLPRDASLGFTFLNDYYQPKHEDPALRGDRNLVLLGVEVIGPLDPRAPPAAAGWFFLRDPDRGDRGPMRASSAVRRARPMVAEMLRRVWRRPAERGDVTAICRLVKEQVEAGAGFHTGLRVALAAALTSPRFLYRIEPDPPGRGPAPLDGHGIASRLSFALWGSAPDGALLDRAESGGLDEAAEILAVARQMLADPRSDALARNFAAQWLELPNLEHATPDPDRFPGFGPELARAMQEETIRFVAMVRRRGMPVQALLTAPFTVLDERLAAHYRMPLPEGRQGDGDGFAPVDLPVGDGRPGGLLRQGSILALTSNATRTSPVKRGKWVLENLLDAPPPPPPPGFDSLGDEAGAAASAATLREEMARHRADPNCAVCHQRMDAIGLALESFDPLGRWRDEDGGQPVDTSATLPGGLELAGAGDLAAWLADGDALVRTLMRRFFVFAVGRDTTVDDLLALEHAFAGLPEEPTFDEVVLAVIGLEAFRMVGAASPTGEEQRR